MLGGGGVTDGVGAFAVFLGPHGIRGEGGTEESWVGFVQLYSNSELARQNFIFIVGTVLSKYRQIWKKCERSFSVLE